MSGTANGAQHMKALGIQVGLAVLLAALGSCAAGYVVAGSAPANALGPLRDLGIIVLALLSLVMAAAWAGIYLGAAWAVGRFGGKGVSALSWVHGRVATLEGAIGRGAERMVVRPVAGASGRIAAGSTFVRRLAGGARPAAYPRAALAPVTSLVRQLREAPRLRRRRPAALYARQGNELASGLSLPDGLPADRPRALREAVAEPAGRPAARSGVSPAGRV